MTGVNDETSVRRWPTAVLLLGLTSFLTDVGSEMIFPLLPIFLSATLGAAPAFLGLIEGIADATASMLKLVTGYVADRLEHRKRVVVFGYGLAAIARPLVALATAPWHVLTVRVADRVGKGVRSTPRDVILADSAPPGAAGRVFGFHRAMDHAGAVVGPLIASGLLLLGWSLRAVFLCAVLPGALSVAAVLLVKEPPARGPREERPSKAKVRRSSRPQLRVYLLILLLFSLGNSSDAFILLRAKDLGVGVATLPILWTVLHVSKLASSYLGGTWSDRVPRVRLIASGWIVYAFTYLGLAFVRSTWHVWLLFIVYGSYYGLSEPAEKALVKDIVPQDRRGRGFGAYNFVLGASAVPASLLTGGLWQRFGPSVALCAGAAIAFVSAVLLTVWDVGRRGSEATASSRAIP